MASKRFSACIRHRQKSYTLGTQLRRPFGRWQWRDGLDEVRVVWYHPIEALIARREAIGAFCAFTVKRSEPGKVIYDWQGEVTEGSVPLKERYARLVPLLSSSGSIDDNWATWEVDLQCLFLPVFLWLHSAAPSCVSCPGWAQLGVLQQDINLNEAARPASYQL